MLEQRVLQWLPYLSAAQSSLAELDCMLSLATCAKEMKLVRPSVVADGGTIRVVNGWHPLLGGPDGAHLVPNDCELGGVSADRLVLLTGPNASGKTVYLRTVALIVCTRAAGRRTHTPPPAHTGAPPRHRRGSLAFASAAAAACAQTWRTSARSSRPRRRPSA